MRRGANGGVDILTLLRKRNPILYSCAAKLNYTGPPKQATQETRPVGETKAAETEVGLGS